MIRRFAYMVLVALCPFVFVACTAEEGTQTTETAAPVTLEEPEQQQVEVPAPPEPLPGQGEDAGQTVVYRDTWGVAHIYAPTVEAGLYAQGWAMAQDRPEQLLVNFMIAIGEYAEVVGSGAVQSDLRSHMWDHYGVAERNFDRIRDELQDHLRAFVRGINAFYDAHPEDVPEWWGDRDIDPYMVIAFSRLFLYNWSIDEAYGDLKRAGIDPGYDRESRGSNQWAVAPSRSAVEAPILLIDPHLSWWGPSRFWEFRIHAGNLHGSGVTLPGSPYIGLGHNEHLAWAMTTGGPDTADVYALTLDPEDPMKYKYGDEWREITTREVTLDVRGEDSQTHELLFSHHGPIIAIRDGKAYAAKISYAEIVNVNEAWYHLNFGTDYTGAVDALDTLTVFPQNVMVADTSGNIYYQRTGRVPERPEGFDWSLPVDGSTPDSEWTGVHPSSDHLQVLNPPHGYMQNCNIPPDAMMKDSVFALDDYTPYLYSSRDYGNRSGWTNQRGARAVQLLHNDSSVTIEEALAYAVDVRVYGAERWIQALQEAYDAHGEQFAENADLAGAITDLLEWDGELHRDSTGALKYYYWRERLDENGPDGLAGRIDQWYSVVTGTPESPPEVTEDDRQAMLQAFLDAMEALRTEMGSLDAAYGDKFRVGRDDNSWPVGGGGSHGTRTLRSMSYGGEKEDFTQWGRGGQTSTQIVVLTEPIQSWMYLPVGNSDRPESPHYDDQAEKVFSPRELKPTWWLPEDLADNVESRTVLEDAA